MGRRWSPVGCVTTYRPTGRGGPREETFEIDRAHDVAKLTVVPEGVEIQSAVFEGVGQPWARLVAGLTARRETSARTSLEA
jgi:hypothetical protein